MESATSPSKKNDNIPSPRESNGPVSSYRVPPYLTPKLVPLQLVILAIYPITVLLGVISNHPAESYFARKDNLINVLFLKLAWAWTSLAFFLHLIRVPQKIGPSTRYVIATVWWYLVTQWCFGPPIMDKVSRSKKSG
jgi:hypothetical protein